MAKIYLSPERRPAPHGPYCGYPGLSEHEVCCAIAELTAAALTRCGYEVKVGSPEDDIRHRVAEATAWGADYYLPIHTNASGTSGQGTAQGPMVLRCGKSGSPSDKACQITYRHLMAIYPRVTQRGVIQNTSFYEIVATPMLSVYPELAFHDNAADARWIVENKAAIAEALCKGVAEYFGTDYIAPHPSVESVTAEQYREQLAALQHRADELCRSVTAALQQFTAEG